MLDRIKQRTAPFLHAIAKGAAGCVLDESSLRASSLAFSLLFCLAPIGAMVLALSALFPHAFSFVPALSDVIGPKVLPSAINEAALAFKTFSANAENLSTISLAFSIVSTMLLSMQIERCVQASWGLDPAPDSANPFVRHWIALTLTPCALALLGAAAYEALALSPAVGSTTISFVLLFSFFLICSWALPAGRPPILIAAAASALATIEALAIQIGFGFVWSHSQTYGVIYGAAAAFVGALLWIWLFWLSLLSSISLASTYFLGRERNLREAGLDWLIEHPPLAHQAAASPSPSLSGKALGPDYEMPALLALAANPDFCDTELFHDILAERTSIEAVRESLARACAGARVARLLELNGNDKGPLANGFSRDIIPNEPLQTESSATQETSFIKEPDHESKK